MVYYGIAERKLKEEKYKGYIIIINKEGDEYNYQIKKNGRVVDEDHVYGYSKKEIIELIKFDIDASVGKGKPLHINRIVAYNI